MKKRIARIACLSLTLIMLVCCMSGCGGGKKSGEVYKLSFSIGDPATSSKAVYYQSLADKVYEATDGGLEITVYPGGTLFSHFEVREGVISGGTDIGWFPTPFAPGQYPLSEILQLPLQFDNQMALTYTYLELYKQVPELQNELSNVKVLGLYAGPANYLFTTNPVTTPDDLRGLQIRTMSGVPADCLTAWGASPSFISPTEIYEAMDKGVIQGFTFDWSGVDSNTLFEVINYQIDLPLYYNPFIIMMNKDSYDKIPDEYKKVFDEIWASDAASYDYARIFTDEAAATEQRAYDEYGVEEIEPDMAAFRVYTDQYVDNWVKKNTTDTFDAQAYLDLAMELYAKGCELYPQN